MIELKNRFLFKVNKQTDGCWLWTGTISDNGEQR